MNDKKTIPNPVFTPQNMANIDAWAFGFINKGGATILNATVVGKAC